MTGTFDNAAQSHMIDLPAGRFHYLTWGAERSHLPCALLLHGITSSALSWVRVGPALAQRYRVYALDMRGHGESIKPSSGAYSLRHTADDALAFIQALDLQEPLLMGHSWGGATALVLASGAGSEQPIPAFSHIVLEDPAVDFGHGDPEKRAASYTRDIGRPSAELRVEIAANNPGWTEADIEGKIDALKHVSREAVVNVFAEATPLGSILPLLAQLASTTLLVRADPNLGTTLPEDAWEQARRALPSHSLAVQIDGATHNIHRSQFDAFMQAVNHFLGSDTTTR
ncbi:MAG: alpha/beta hydrolase [Ktedonobacteraceae bacterium]|nr:alpha/beta hydrolase [Ktedonobacteraceae bacterium]